MVNPFKRFEELMRRLEERGDYLQRLHEQGMLGTPGIGPGFSLPPQDVMRAMQSGHVVTRVDIGENDHGIRYRYRSSAGTSYFLVYDKRDGSRLSKALALHLSDGQVDLGTLEERAAAGEIRDLSVTVPPINQALHIGAVRTIHYLDDFEFEPYFR